MRLRRDPLRPQRLEDEMAECGKHSRRVTTPAYPDLLCAQVAPFNPQLPLAAFPSLTGRTHPSYSEVKGATRKQINDEESNAERCQNFGQLFENGSYPKTRQVPTLPSAAYVPLEDEMRASDEGPGRDSRCDYGSERSSFYGTANRYPIEQVFPCDNVEWKQLCPAVQLATIDRMSDNYPLSNVYEMLGLCVQELEEVQMLAIQYKEQNQIEDHFVLSMQKDQLNSILRTDHTSKIRGAPEALQEFQTQSYIRRIQLSLDEKLVQATRAEVSLGKMFLSQRSIPRHMAGCWGQTPGKICSTCSDDHHLEPQEPLAANRTGLDSGYVSAVVTPNRVDIRAEPDAAFRPQHHETPRCTRTTDSANTQGSGCSNALQTSSQSRRGEHSRVQGKPYQPLDEAATTCPRGRSRRTVRRASRYKERMADLKLRGNSCDDENDRVMSTESQQESVGSRQPEAQAWLRTRADKRMIGCRSRSSSPPIAGESAVRPSRTGHNQLMVSSTVIPRAQLLNPREAKDLLPLQRVVLKPPKRTARARADGAVPALGAPVTSRSHQSLLGRRNGNELPNLLVKTSARAVGAAMPWTASKTNTGAEIDRFPNILSQACKHGRVVAQTANGEYSGPVIGEDLKKLPIQEITYSSSPTTSKGQHSASNSGFIVTDASSPIPSQRGSFAVSPGTTTKPTPTNETIGPVSSNTLNHQSFPYGRTSISLPTKERAEISLHDPADITTPSKQTTISTPFGPSTCTSVARSPHASLPTPQSPANHDTNHAKPAATRTTKAAADSCTKPPPFLITANDSTSSSITSSMTEAPRRHGTSQTQSEPATPIPNSTPSQGRRKRQYRKSEQQKQKEAERRERLERERQKRQEKGYDETGDS